MPNVTSEQRLIDSTSRAVIKFTGYGVAPADLANVANTTLIDVSSLAYALNANSPQTIMVGNVNPLPFYGVTVNRVWGYAKSSGILKLQWKSQTNNDIIMVGGTGNFDFPQNQGGVGIPLTNPNGTTDTANNNGDILISSYGFAANDVYTIFVDLKKDARYYDAGQTADPKAFNR